MMNKRLSNTKGFVTRNWMKILWVTILLTVALTMTSQGLAGPFDGPCPPPR